MRNYRAVFTNRRVSSFAKKRILHRLLCCAVLFGWIGIAKNILNLIRYLWTPLRGAFSYGGHDICSSYPACI